MWGIIYKANKTFWKRFLTLNRDINAYKFRWIARYYTRQTVLSEIRTFLSISLFHYLRLYINSFLIFLVCKGNPGAPKSFSKPKIKVNFRSYNSSLRIKSEQWVEIHHRYQLWCRWSWVQTRADYLVVIEKWSIRVYVFHINQRL